MDFYEVTVVNGNKTEYAKFKVRGVMHRAKDGRSDCIVMNAKETARVCMLLLYWRLGDRDTDAKYGNSFFTCGRTRTTYLDLCCERSDDRMLAFRTPGELVDRYTEGIGRECDFNTMFGSEEVR